MLKELKTDSELSWRNVREMLQRKVRRVQGFPLWRPKGLMEDWWALVGEGSVDIQPWQGCSGWVIWISGYLQPGKSLRTVLCKSPGLQLFARTEAKVFTSVILLLENIIHFTQPVEPALMRYTLCITLHLYNVCGNSRCNRWMSVSRFTEPQINMAYRLRWTVSFMVFTSVYTEWKTHAEIHLSLCAQTAL